MPAPKARWIALILILIAGGVGSFFLWRTDPVPAPSLPRLEGIESSVANKIQLLHRRLVEGGDEDDWGRYARTLHVHGMNEDALDAYEVASEIADDPFEYVYLMGIINAERDVYKAIENLERARDMRANFAPLHLWLGRAYLDAGRLEDSTRAYEAAVALRDDSHGHLGLGRAALRAGDADTAISHLKKARARNPEHREVHATLALAYREAGRESYARTVASRAATIATNTPVLDSVMTRVGAEGVSYQTYLSRGLERAIGGDLREAERFVGLALASRPGDMTARIERAKIQIKMGEFDRAVTGLNEILAERQDFPEALRLIGMAHNDAGRPYQAMPPLLRCVGLNPEDVKARLALADSYIRANNARSAAPHVEKALQLDPNNLDALLQSAFVLMRSGRKAEGATQVRKVLAIVPNHERALTLMRDVFAQ